MEHEVERFDVEGFLKEYKQHPCLWDKGHVHYKDRQMRNLAEDILMRKTGINDIKFLKKKMRSIRGTYNTEIRRIRNSIKNGKKIYKPRLIWFETADKFLRPMTELYAETNWDVEDSQDASQHEIITSDIDTYSNSQESNDEIAQYSSNPMTGPHPAKKFNVQPENGATLHRAHVVSFVHNEFIAFGNSIAFQLQNLPLEMALQLQTDIQSLISNTRLNYLRNNKTAPSNTSLRSSSDFSTPQTSPQSTIDNCNTSHTNIKQENLDVQDYLSN